MLNSNDIKERSVLIINSLEHKTFRVKMGFLAVEDTTTGEMVSRHPFYSLHAVFVIGHTSLTSPVLEAFRKKGVCIVIFKPNFRIVHIFAPSAEANFLLRQKQYTFNSDFEVAKTLIENKIENQINLLKKIRDKTNELKEAIEKASQYLNIAIKTERVEDLSAMEGNVSKLFFQNFFGEYGWQRRQPRVKQDYLNVILDIGYTFLFNFMDGMVNLFGFDTYKGVLHKQWFKRKSLICDLVEPFRCIIDYEIKKALNLGQFKEEHFTLIKREYVLKRGNEKIYMLVFGKILSEYKDEIFCYVRDYYRCFMGQKSVSQYPKYYIK